MKREEAIKIIRKELSCVDRDNCKREECKSCDLVMPSKEPILEAYKMAIKALEQESVLDKIRSEITNCLKALDDIEKSGLNIYLPNEMSGRRLTYQQCLKFIDKYKTESE